MYKIIRLLLSIIVFLLVCATNYTFAEDNKIRVVFVSWEPYGYVENNQAIGFELDIFANIIKMMNLEVEFNERPWKRCLFMVEHGLADVVISALKTPEREGYMIYPEEFISISKTALFTTTDQEIQLSKSYESLRDYTIGVTAGFAYGTEFDSANFLKKDENTTTAGIVTKLMMGRYQLGIGNIAVISSIAQKQGVRDKIHFLKPMVHSQKLYAAFSRKKNHQDLIDKFSKILTSYKVTQRYKEILFKYGISYESQVP